MEKKSTHLKRGGLTEVFINLVGPMSRFSTSLPIEQVTDEVINLNQINRKEKTKQKRKQSVWDSGHLYQRLILDTMDGNDWFSKMIEIYHSWICKYLDNDKKPTYWQPRSYIRECYLQQKIL